MINILVLSQRMAVSTADCYKIHGATALEPKNLDGKIMEVDEMAILNDPVESGDEIKVDKY
jgi:hypothetical protein